MKSWVSHISGATEIARVRGRNQLQTEIGRRVFQDLCGAIVISTALYHQQPKSNRNSDD